MRRLWVLCNLSSSVLEGWKFCPLRGEEGGLGLDLAIILRSLWKEINLRIFKNKASEIECIFRGPLEA